MKNYLSESLYLSRALHQVSVSRSPSDRLTHGCGTGWLDLGPFPKSYDLDGR